MQLFDLRVGSYQQRLHVLYWKRTNVYGGSAGPGCLQNFFRKIMMVQASGISGMLNGVFHTRFVYQYRTGVGIKRVAKSIVAEIT